MLSLINAFVSHELRNPLNSIKAQNIEKSYLYQSIKESLISVKNENIKEISSNIQNKIIQL